LWPISFVADMVLADMVVADIDFPCGRYGFFAVADIVLLWPYGCGRYGRTPRLVCTQFVVQWAGPDFRVYHVYIVIFVSIVYGFFCDFDVRWSSSAVFVNTNY